MNNRIVRASMLMLMMGLMGVASYAKAPIGVEKKRANGFRTADACLPPSASAQLDVNNVRALMHNGGDMWWDLVGDPRYEIPKGSNRHSMFASSLWIGGIDEAGQLRVAAQTYRQGGIDFWAGPITDGEASTDDETCQRYNRMYKINKTEIDAFRADWADGALDNAENYPNVMGWPGTGTNADGANVEVFRNDGTVLYLAPFVDVDGDPFNYNPEAGDFPDIRGDQAVWWVLNDKGDIHTETGAEPVGIEIHMLAFAFTTANAVNDMTFYQQTVINRSNLSLNDTYMGQWVDADLGVFNDDFVGCDTLRGLGMCYNGDPDDDGAAGYGTNPPAVGVDFFQGPLADPGDGIDNDKDGVTDELNETIIMSKFVYYNNDFSLTGNPEVAQHYYGYLSGFWKDGTPIVDNFSNGNEGNGYGPSSAGVPTNFMFPGDPCTSSGWTEGNSGPGGQGNPPADRRFLQSAGPFTLQPGAVNEIVTGVVWARGFYNDQLGSICELQRADDVAQALFDSGFTLLDGPDAPELTISEYNQELNLTWGYSEALRTVRNNFNESYEQADPVLKANNVRDSVFEFQGYIVYQLIDGTVGPNELNDPDRARPVVQCDVQDGISSIVNRVEQRVEGLNEPIIVDEVMVQGADEGIFLSTRVTTDLFATSGDTRLRNYTTYYFTAIAYAYNDTASDGRKFVQGNRFFQIVPALPHPEEIDNVGTVINADYGDGIPVTMTAGVGNGGNFVRIDPATEAELFSPPYLTSNIKYLPGTAPVDVKVVDPKAVVGSYYQLEVPGNKFLRLEEIVNDTNPATGEVLIVKDSIFAEWILSEGSSDQGPFQELFVSTYNKRDNGSPARPMPLVGTERVIPDRGFSIAVQDVGTAGDTLDVLNDNGIIGAELAFTDISQSWLTGLPDNNDLGGGIWNWIDTDDKLFRSQRLHDKSGNFSNILGGRWAPWALSRRFNNEIQGGGQIAPGVTIANDRSNRQMGIDEVVTLDKLADVDIVFTNDITKWSRCMVVETSPNSGLGSGAWQLSGKWRDNVDQAGSSEGAKTATNHGMSWFPGYAIDVNTGERLNIFFGESEWDKLNNGDDMIFNPTTDFGTNLDRVGGRHYVYVTNTLYDEFNSLKGILQNADEAAGGGLFSDALNFDGTGNHLGDLYQYVTWVGIPLLNPGYSFTAPQEIPTDARISLRVNQPFSSRKGTNDVPTFTFNTIDIAALTNQSDVAEDALDDVLVVPNPYYAYSAYERGQLDNIIKVTNLPQRCKISIFTINGQLVRQYNKDSDAPDQNWDLKNHSGVPVASGVYIVHVDAFELGEKVLKLFAVMRQIDLDNF